MSPAQKIVVVQRREALRLLLDDLLAVTPMRSSMTRSRAQIWATACATSAKACRIRISRIVTDNGKEFSSGLLACDGAAGKRHEFDALYNHQLPQFALKDQTPMQAMKAWYDEKPELFHRQPRASNRPGYDSYRTLLYPCCYPRMQ
ncbi:hypothetical protein [Allofranklinella schreckenbergeri]|uniref:hypothetical protein n=1 Tax=Allofranklinella schreckenbergeri TaxID=1076744 RepID=UPI0011C40AC6